MEAGPPYHIDLPSPRTPCGGYQQHPDRDLPLREPRTSQGADHILCWVLLGATS